MRFCKRNSQRIFLTKKTKINEGEVPQYYIEESHEPIISPEDFEEVQAEFTRRKKLGRKYSGSTMFSAKLVCGDCGHFFGSKVWHSTSKYRRVIWQCNNKFKGEHFCSTPHLYEDEIKIRFISAFAAFFRTEKWCWKLAGCCWRICPILLLWILK